MTWSGFCVGGVDWPRPELADVTDPAEIARRTEGVAAEEARMVEREGGNLIRLFWDVGGAFPAARAEIAEAVGSFQPGPQSGQGLYQLTVDERLEHLDTSARLLDRLARTVAGAAGGDLPLDLSALDAYVRGVAGSGTGVRLLLTLVSPVPRRIIEAPSDATLAAHGRPYTFEVLWAAYVRTHVGLLRELLRRYVAEPTQRVESPVVVAFELGNEPDYVWIPEEMKIEGAAEPLVYPLAKYVTELQLGQVPERMEAAPPFERTAWGYQHQDAQWSTRGTPAPPTPLRDFDWGRKFDWYLRCFGDLQAAGAAALAEDARAHGVHVDVVAASVTHNNLDYLVRLERARPGAFADVTAIGLHPYHWVRNDVWDARFVDPSHPTSGWADASPRAFAADYFKRFDFVSELARHTGGAPSRPWLRRRDDLADELRRVLAGKRLWLTEFGIGTKMLGSFNAPVAELTRFIRPRGDVGGAGQYDAAVWEDLWESFLDQVPPAFLREHAVDCVLLYSLREAGVAGLDMGDDDRSNLAVLRRDGTSRLDPVTLGRLRGLLAGVRDRTVAATAAVDPRPAVELHRRPWRSIGLADDVAAVTTMLSAEERKLLYWLTARWYRGEGDIVDGGCFVGGSTLALGRGLQANPAVSGGKIRVYDLFRADEFAVDAYLAERGIAPGQSFRPVFDELTAGVADLLDVHEGDFLAAPAGEGPVEILFIDLAKSPALNDGVVARFFPRLVPDRSVVVQQDLVFPFCPWLAVTMEHLAEYFEPVAFVEYNSLVYVCREAVPAEVAAAPVSALPVERQLELLGRAVVRMRGYPRGLLELGRAVLLGQSGDVEAARHVVEGTAAEFDGQPVVAAQVAELRAWLGAA